MVGGAVKDEEADVILLALEEGEIVELLPPPAAAPDEVVDGERPGGRTEKDGTPTDDLLEDGEVLDTAAGSLPGTEA